MIYDYNFYCTDESFDYGDFWGGTCHETCYHGFSIDIDKNDFVDITTLKPYGECFYVMKDIKTLQQLKNFIIENFSMIEDLGSTVSNIEIFEELVSFIDGSIKKEVA